MESLLSKDEFIGISNVAHLAAGGETPALASHLAAAMRFWSDKGSGMPGRERMEQTARHAKEAVARLVGGQPGDVALLASASEGLFVAASGIDWRAGDNVVVEAGEYPSVRYAWQRLPVQVNLRTVGHGPIAAFEEFRDAVDARTRVIAISLVSYLTGIRRDLAAFRELADAVRARLVVDASHALGVVPVDGSMCDAVVSAAYKFLLGVHGVGVFYVNSRRWPDLEPPWIGWHSVVAAGWRERSRGLYRLKTDAERFEIGNLGWLGVYVLENALKRLERLGQPEIGQHILMLGDELWRGLRALDLDLLTPEAPSDRAGNICFAVEAPERLEEALRQEGVIVWGSEGRIRMSLHAYNDSRDVARGLKALREFLRARSGG